MAFLHVEDYTHTAEVIAFPSVYKKIESWLEQHTAFIIKGNIDQAAVVGCKILADEIVPIDLVLQEWKNIQKLTLHLPETIDTDTLSRIKKEWVSGRIPVTFTFKENNRFVRFMSAKKITLDEQFLRSCEGLGIQVVLTL